MKRIAILGCENSHANAFLKFIREKEEFSDIEVVGVYSDQREAAEKLNQQFGVPVLADYADAVGQLDGLIVTARHGDNHFLLQGNLPYPEIKSASSVAPALAG